MKVVCVLRSGGRYDPDWVRRLARQLDRHGHGAELVALSDVLVPGVETVPLLEDWPGWWAKMELFRPGLDAYGDGFLYVDLDTVLFGDIRDFLVPRRFTVLRDFYRRRGIQSSLMWLTQEVRARVWDAWTEDPETWMRRYAGGGDQSFLESVYPQGGYDYWQDVLPGQVASYKVHGANDPATRILCFHGRPKQPDVTHWRVREAWG